MPVLWWIKALSEQKFAELLRTICIYLTRGFIIFGCVLTDLFFQTFLECVTCDGWCHGILQGYWSLLNIEWARGYWTHVSSCGTHQHTISVLKSISMSLFPLIFGTVSPFSFWGVCWCWYILNTKVEVELQWLPHMCSDLLQVDPSLIWNHCNIST